MKLPKNKKNHKSSLILLLIILIGFGFRFLNSNWDDNHHLHPDERFLTMVGLDLKLPSSFNDYLNQNISTFNPRNMGQDFYVYGNLPLVTNKLLALQLNNDNYNRFTIQGRQLSAFFDLLSLIIVIKLTTLFQKKYKLPKDLKYWSGFIYATAVLPIQLSHFFAVDTFANFFVLTSFFFAFKFSLDKKYKNIYLFLSAIFFGFAIASKLNALFVLPLNLFFLLKNKEKLFSQKIILNNLINYFIYGATSYFALRISDPYLFASNNLFNPNISPEFIENLETLNLWSRADNWFPPAIQWINKKPIIFSLKNMAIFGIGIASFSFLILGFINSTKQLLYKKSFYKKNWQKTAEILIISLWCLAFFAYQSTQFVKALRYFIFLYPFISIMTGYGIIKTINFFKNKITKSTLNYLALNLLFILLTLVWPLMFISVYIQPHSRITASEWMYRNMPDNSYLLNELWDDPLPLQVQQQYGKEFTGEMVPIFEIDSDIKWQNITGQLNKSDFYILSSNRAWGSIQKVPQKYPQTIIFYDNFLNEKSNYKKVADFTSYPSLKYLGIPLTFPDDWADETFTVYDHPRVMIYKNEKEN